jgi:hypothetical protein
MYASGLPQGKPPGKGDAPHERAILQIRHYMQLLVVLNGLFVLIIGSVCVLLSFQLRKYTAISSENVNSMALNALTISKNAAQISASVVPISENAQFLSNAVVATLAGAFNTTANATAYAVSQGDTGRHLMFDPNGEHETYVVDQNDLLNADLKMRQTVFKLSRTLLQTANTKLSEFNPAAVSDLMEWVVGGVNYTSLSSRFDRVMNDIEKTAHFGVLATSMLGIAAAATNTTLPSPSDIMSTFIAQRAAAAPPSSGACN